MLTIGQLAKVTGVAARTIRYYEQVGALPPPNRTAAGYRLYAPGAVDRVLFLRRARALGLSLKEVRSLADALENGLSGSFRPRLRELVRGHLSAVQQQIAELESLRRQLRRVLHRVVRPNLTNRLEVDRRPPGAKRCACLGTEEGAVGR